MGCEGIYSDSFPGAYGLAVGRNPPGCSAVKFATSFLISGRSGTTEKHYTLSEQPPTHATTSEVLNGILMK